MYFVEIECAAEDRDRLSAELWERGTSGIVEEDLAGGSVRLRAFFDEAQPDLAGRWALQEDRDWVEVSHAQWTPLPVGERFYLAPPWSSEATPPGRLRLEMEPGMACGTGWHEATQLALEAMERRIGPGMAVLDVGTGSGILTAAAALLGAAPLFACDIDADAVFVARHRLRRESIGAGLFVGSVRSVKDACANAVVANINAETLVALAPDILRVRKAGGPVILSGFPQRHLERVIEAYGRGQVLEKGDWRALICS